MDYCRFRCFGSGSDASARVIPYRLLYQSFRPSSLDRDWVCWTSSGDGKFSVNSFGKLLFRQCAAEAKWLEVVWRGVAPPKVETFTWLAILGRIPVKVELLKRGITSLANDLCPLCGKFPETVSHLLLSCMVTWKLWMKFASYWGVELVLSDSPYSFLLCWHDIRAGGSTDSIWHVIPYVILWSIWLFRNEMTFKGFILDEDQILYVAKSRLASWYKAKFPLIVISNDSLIFDPSLADKVNSFNTCPNSKIVWKPPPVGFLKLNVDGAVSKNGLGCGVGGILRNNNGECLLSFSEQIGQGPPILAELQAMKMG
ncbi:hypothetical protein V6N12_002541 [Hibiscus sabdariffa]|uniref:Reverse transcriptase zinc-binding domain-containing protein n=1 Tax=Hibiscus sabdariffa TaxID=183260 RepID=A0ABR2ASC6_9ROSI